MTQAGSNDEKNLRSEISLDCPFKKKLTNNVATILILMTKYKILEPFCGIDKEMVAEKRQCHAKNIYQYTLSQKHLVT